MNLLDNLIYTTANDTGTIIPKKAITSKFIKLDDVINPVKPLTPDAAYSDAIRKNFIHLDDPTVIEEAFEKHWYDIKDRQNTTSATVPDPGGHYVDSGNNILTRLDENPIYHLIYAFLVENTRIAQIFERVISLYQQGEDLGITNDNDLAFRWICNTEYLFYKTSGSRQFRNVRSLLRPDFEAIRRNAYQRMFGMDLAFGNSAELKSIHYNYKKAEANNAQFLTTFEQFLSEIWQAYINARNTSGVNTSDLENIEDLARKIREMFRARRGHSKNYTTQNLSREEYSACFMMTWLHLAVIGKEDSDIVKFLKCEGPTEHDRLAKIGMKVGIPAHTKSQAMFDLAGRTAYILTLIEDETPAGIFNSSASIFSIINTRSSGAADSTRLLEDLISVINNWEKATGHRIKNRESNITGTVRIAQVAKSTALVN